MEQLPNNVMESICTKNALNTLMDSRFTKEADGLWEEGILGQFTSKLLALQGIDKTTLYATFSNALVGLNESAFEKDYDVTNYKEKKKEPRHEIILNISSRSLFFTLPIYRK